MALLAMRRRAVDTYPMREFNDVYDRLGRLRNAALGESAEEGPQACALPTSSSPSSRQIEVTA